MLLFGANPCESPADTLEEYVLARQIGRRTLSRYLASQLGYLGLTLDSNEAERDGLFDRLIESQVLIVLPEVLGQYVNVQVGELENTDRRFVSRNKKWSHFSNRSRLISFHDNNGVTWDESGLLASRLLVIIIYCEIIRNWNLVLEC